MARRSTRRLRQTDPLFNRVPRNPAGECDRISPPRRFVSGCVTERSRQLTLQNEKASAHSQASTQEIDFCWERLIRAGVPAAPIAIPSEIALAAGAIVGRDEEGSRWQR